MADRTGQQLGNYRILSLVGRGGFAEVYLGEHIYLKTQVAIKILQAKVANEEDLEGFLKEARTVAHLLHPNIVRVMDFGVDNETPFLVMDYAPNNTLRRRHPKGTILPLPTITTYVKQIAAALQYAHDEKLIHRDVKPENMLLGRKNEVLLSDFGIALIAQSSRYQSTQDVVGTVAYMSPEQIQGKPRPVSDQYSLGIAVYEWLTGDRPFHGSFTELCTQHMFAPPPPLRERVPTLSPDVEHVVTTALAKDPRQRFGSVQAFANALEQASQPGKPDRFNVVTPPPPPPPPPVSLVPPTIAAKASPLPTTNPYTAVSSVNPPIAPPPPITTNPPFTSSSYQSRPVTQPPAEQANRWRIDKQQKKAMFIGSAICAGLMVIASILFLTGYRSYSYSTEQVMMGIAYCFVGLAALTLLFFGSVFGTWTGLVVAGAGTLVGAIVSANILNYPGTFVSINQYFLGYTYIWPEHLGLALIGFISGYAAFKQKGRYNIGRSLGFSALGIIAGSFFAAICNIIFNIGNSYNYANQIWTGFLIIAAIYLGIDLIFLPIVLVIYHKNIVRRKRI